MDHNFKGHIRTAELAKLLEEARGRPESGDVRDAHPHLASCATCREQYNGLISLDRQLKNMNAAESPMADACPSETVWHKIAGGFSPTHEALASVEHASRCSQCGPLLRAAVAELAALNGEITDAERKQISTLASASEDWQLSLAQRITGMQGARLRGVRVRDMQSPQERHGLPWWQAWRTFPRFATATAALVLVIGVGTWVGLRFEIHRSQASSAEQLLARAYTEKRTLELRFAGAAYAPVRISRGPAMSFTSRPASLLKAEALIAPELEVHPDDPAWLQSKAQADLLEGKYDAAVESLRRALELNPGSPSLLTDLGTAQFQRALETNRDQDFGAAFEYLSEALRAHPEDSVALFNRAIVAERQFLYHQAVDDWEHYLRLDSTSEWAEEARTRANAVREKLKQHESGRLPLLSPDQIPIAAPTAGLAAKIDERIDEYLHDAVRTWLPQAFPDSRIALKRINAKQGPAWPLFFLAKLTAERHGDAWFEDLLRGSSDANFSRAVNALALAAKANDAGEYSSSRKQAHLAEQLFSASHNIAGVLRARFELVFADQIERNVKDCRQAATTAMAAADKHSYAWLEIQFSLEKSVCAGLMNDFGDYDRFANRAVEQAQKHDYKSLYLRAIGFAANSRFASGDEFGGSKLISSGLQSFWSAQYPAMRGYNLYTELAHNADDLNRSALRAAAWQEAVGLIDSADDLLLRALAHNALADSSTAAGLPEIAKQHYAEAARLFAAAPRTEASRTGILATEVRTAELEAHQGHYEDAIARLTRIQDQIRPLSNQYLLQLFYSTLGELQLGRQRDEEAEQALRPALGLAEESLATLESDEARITWSKEAAPAYLAMVEARLAQGRSLDALDTYEWYLGAPQRTVDRSSQRSPSLPVTDSRAAAPAPLAPALPLLTNETVLAYAALPDGLAIWEYDNRGVNAHWFPKGADGLQDLVERFRELASDPKSDLTALRRDARSLYQVLIAPVEQNLESGRALLIETQGWLTHVPFEALLDPRNHYLIERAPVVYSMGQDSRSRLRAESRLVPSQPVLIVGSAASSPAEGLYPLPDAAAEADSVARNFSFAHVFEGKEVTLSNVRNTLPRVVVFHFAGHSSANPERQGLLLQGATGKLGEILDTDQIRHISLSKLQLAVLSACNTAEQSESARGFESIGEAFLRNGVPHVVASRWAIDSVESRAFVANFYQQVLAGTPVSEAIQRISRTLLSQPQTSHPFYWSAFAAYGKR